MWNEMQLKKPKILWSTHMLTAIFLAGWEKKTGKETTLRKLRKSTKSIKKVNEVDQVQEDSVEKVDQVQGDKDGDPDWHGLIQRWGRSCSWGFNWCHYPTPIDLGNSPVDRDGAHIATRLLGTKLEYRDGAHVAPILAASGALQLLVPDQVEHRDESRVAVAAAPSRPLRLGLRLRGLRVQVEFRQKTGKLHEWRWLSIFIIFWQRSSN